MGLGALLGPDPLGDHRGGYTRFELWITKATQNDKTTKRRPSRDLSSGAIRYSTLV